MVEDVLLVGLVVEETGLTSERDASWRPVTVFPVPPDVAPWTPLGTHAGHKRYYAGQANVHLYSTETANYVSNLETGEPQLWVILRAGTGAGPIDIVSVTADPAEGEAHTEAGADMVEPVAMPLEIAGEVAAFCAAHHVERPFIKRQRDRKKPGDRRKQD